MSVASTPVLNSRAAAGRCGTASQQRSRLHGRPPTRRGHRRPLRSAGDADVLGQYADGDGRSRQIVARAGAGGSVLVIDHDGVTFGDRRLVAHLAADEPAENALIVVGEYLVDHRSRRCRRVTAADLNAIPRWPRLPVRRVLLPAHLWNRRAARDRLQAIVATARVDYGVAQPVGSVVVFGEPRMRTLRDVVGALESYEPVRTLTREALVRPRGEAQVSVAVLRAELRRFSASRFVLNRRLREVTLAIAKADDVSMSEIALRCKRFKRTTRGHVCGDTSWLARKLGLLADSGESAPTPWCDGDVLALIARDGLGISPREVELA